MRNRKSKIGGGAKPPYAEGVTQHSPGSRSAPWVEGPALTSRTLKGFYKAPFSCRCATLSGLTEIVVARLPRVRCATLGCVVQPLRGKERRGFTLTELLVVVMIMVILFSIAIPLLKPALEDRKVREASR